MTEQAFQVLLNQGAEQDLEAIYNYIAEFDTKASAGCLNAGCRELSQLSLNEAITRKNSAA